MNSDLVVWPFRFRLRAVEPVYFPPGKAANVLRGAFGTIFRRMACAPSCVDARTCEIAGHCAYALLFEPRQEWSGAAGPSGLADWPRPFVFRALHLDGRRLERGEEFYFDVVLFDSPGKTLPYFVSVFRELAEAGLGASRGRAKLEAVEDLAGGQLVFDGQRMRDVSLTGRRFEFGGPPVDGALGRLLVRFLTPTELKVGGELAARPDFGILMRRIRDRVSNLRAFYQGGALEIDFEALADLADRVAMTRCAVHHEEAERRSSRTGMRHSLGGFVGEAEYEGLFGPFVEYLRAGESVGVGRQTVWGKGCFELKEASGCSPSGTA